MQKIKLGFCLFLGLLGLIALSTAIAAEFNHTKADQVKYEHGECTLPSSPALWLGSAAAIALVVAQLSANAMGGCVCCCTENMHKISSRNRSIAVLSLFLSWLTFGFALFLLVAGAGMNERQPYKKQWMDRECYVVKTGIFASAGALSMFTVMLSMVFYLAISTNKVEDERVENVNSGPNEHIAVDVAYPDGVKELPSK